MVISLACQLRWQWGGNGPWLHSQSPPLNTTKSDSVEPRWIFSNVAKQQTLSNQRSIESIDRVDRIDRCRRSIDRIDGSSKSSRRRRGERGLGMQSIISESPGRGGLESVPPARNHRVGSFMLPSCSWILWPRYGLLLLLLVAVPARVERRNLSFFFSSWVEQCRRLEFSHP